MENGKLFAMVGQWQSGWISHKKWLEVDLDGGEDLEKEEKRLF